jgi:hypothetical protein
MCLTVTLQAALNRTSVRLLVRALAKITASPVSAVLHVDDQAENWCQAWAENFALVRPGEIEVRFEFTESTAAP